MLSIHKLCMKLLEPEMKTPNTDDKIVMLTPILHPTVEVLREQEAYPILSLVADIGGILGLFIGFNFLMIFDWIVLPFKRFVDFFHKRY